MPCWPSPALPCTATPCSRAASTRCRPATHGLRPGGRGMVPRRRRGLCARPAAARRPVDGLWRGFCRLPGWFWPGCQPALPGRGGAARPLLDRSPPGGACARARPCVAGTADTRSARRPVPAPHPAARWAWCDAHPAYSLWQRQREGLALDAPCPGRARAACSHARAMPCNGRPCHGGRSLSGGLRSRPARGRRRRLRTERRAGRRPVRP